jgi:predicted TIM-barrel fold metal-dependent hydrolase
MAATRTATVDACVHHHWESQSEVMKYMTRGWREYLSQPASLPGDLEAIPLIPLLPYRHPDGDTLPGGAQGQTRVETLCEQIFDRPGQMAIDRVVLSHDAAMLTPLTPNAHLASEIARAVNQWTLEHWIQRDARLHGLILIPSQTPEEAAREVRRMGSEPGMAGVLMAANGLGRPFGHPAYHPIYEAAAEYDLPIVIRAGGDAVAETLTHATAGGLPTTFADYAILTPQSVMTHLTSLIAQGAFVRYPGLRVVVQGAGVAWVPSLFWRFDTEYGAYRRETPWLTEHPSDYLRSRVSICTNPLEAAPTKEQLWRYLRAFGGMEDLLVYASGYPTWNTNWPEAVLDGLPEEWHERVFSTNALKAFRWSVPAERREQEPTAAVGEMQSSIV